MAHAEHGNAPAQAIIDNAATHLAKLAIRTVQLIEPVTAPLALAVAGGVLTGSPRLRQQLHIQLRTSGLECDMNLVEEPLAGCVRLADPQYAGTLVHWR